MFIVEDNNIEMVEGDYGSILPITITEGQIVEGDVLKFVIQTNSHNTIIEKTLTKNEGNYEFYLTEQETKLLKAGSYLWGLKQYRNNLLVCHLAVNNVFKVTKGQ